MNNVAFMNNALKHLGEDGSETRKWYGMGGNWCDMFVTKCFYEKDKSLWFGKQSYCPTTIHILRAHLAEIPMYLAMPGDVIFFDWDRNGVPNHIGLVLERISSSEIKTLEGNTGKPARVRKVKRNNKYPVWIFRPHFKPKSTPKKGVLDADGNFGYHSIYNLQLALGMKPNGILTKETVKFLQKKVGASEDGAWGASTSRHVQAMLAKAGCYDGKIDGAFGKNSVIALQKWTNKVNYPPVKKKPSKPKPTPKKTTPVAKTKAEVKNKAIKQTNQQKLLAKMKELAWAYGTAKKKYAYKTGAPKKVCKIAMKKYGWADNKAEMSDCGNFVSTVVRESGVDKSFKALHGTKTPFPKTEKAFKIVLKGKKVPKDFLKPGDIIRYKKKNGNQHTQFYFGNGKVCEASHHNRFGAIVKDEKKYNNSKIAKISTVQVLRAKE